MGRIQCASERFRSNEGGREGADGRVEVLIANVRAILVFIVCDLFIALLLLRSGSTQHVTWRLEPGSRGKLV
jgi:hypothetical protein